VRTGIEELEQVERWLLGACRGLGMRIQSATDDFFAAGGSSLTAVRLISMAEKRFGEGVLPPEDLFEDSELSKIAANILRRSTYRFKVSAA